jgi:hypothetical protein
MDDADSAVYQRYKRKYFPYPGYVRGGKCLRRYLLRHGTDAPEFINTTD